MKLYVVKEGERVVWVAAMAGDKVYSYVANTRRFHDNHALRNDFYLERWFTYEPIGPTEARRLIDEGVGRIADDSESLERWQADVRPLYPGDVLAMAAGQND